MKLCRYCNLLKNLRFNSYKGISFSNNVPPGDNTLRLGYIRAINNTLRLLVIIVTFSYPLKRGSYA
jgi:hypothetical protein